MKTLLPYTRFIESFRDVPRFAVSLLFFEKDELFLTKRAIEPFKDYWHLPGSFVLKGELINDCINRIAEKELPFMIDPKNVVFFEFNENLKKDPRGHIIEAIFLVQAIKGKNRKFTRKETSEAKFFKRLPKNVGFGHDRYLAKFF